MKDYKKMYVVNGCNLSEEEFKDILAFFNGFSFSSDRFDCSNQFIHLNNVTQFIDGFEVHIYTYYFNYFGKYIEIGQEIISKKK